MLRANALFKLSDELAVPSSRLAAAAGLRERTPLFKARRPAGFGGSGVTVILAIVRYRETGDAWRTRKC